MFSLKQTVVGKGRTILIFGRLPFSQFSPVTVTRLGKPLLFCTTATSRAAAGGSMDRKAPKSEGNLNADICEALMELAIWEKNVNRNQHKHNAYRKAAETLAALDHRVESGKEARKLPGVGEKIALKIDEILETGRLGKLATIRSDDTAAAVNTLTRVAGIGPAKARELVEAGISTIEQLREHEDRLTRAQRIGLKYVEEFEQRIPRAEIQQIQARIRRAVKSLDGRYVLTVCGSYRRGAATSGDIDILLTHPDHEAEEEGRESSGGGQLLRRVVTELRTAGIITDTLSLGDTKFMGVCQLDGEAAPRRLDLRLVPPSQYHCGVLYFTGSDLFNKRMRAHALDQGFTLNEYSLRPLVEGKPDVPLPVSSERDIFDYLDYPFKLPKDRNG